MIKWDQMLWSGDDDDISHHDDEDDKGKMISIGALVQYQTLGSNGDDPGNGIFRVTLMTIYI